MNDIRIVPIEDPNAPPNTLYFIDPGALIHGGLLLADWLRLCDILCGYDIRWYDSRQPTEAP